MKMMSRTSVMSTSGVTLTLTIIGPGSSSPLPKLLARATVLTLGPGGGRGPAGDRREDPMGQGVDLRHCLADPSLEDVESHHGGDGHQEADGGRHQRLGDAGHD